MRDGHTQVQRELLEHLRLPAGAANVLFRKSPTGGALVVLYAPGSRFNPDHKPTTFGGLPVIYQPRKVVRAFA